MTVRERQDDGAGAQDPAVGGQSPTGSGGLRERARKRRRKRRSERRQPWRLTAPNALLLLVILGSVLPLGSIHVPILLGVAAVTLVAVVAALLSPGRLPGKVPGAAVVLGALAIFTVLQAVPIPFGLLGHLSPVAADIWARALRPLGEGAPALAHLSLDPGASWVEALKWWTYAAVFVAASAFGARHGASWGAVLVLGAALVVALSTIGHGVMGATRVFGIYTPTFGGAGYRLGAILNLNALAGYLNLGLLAGVGLVASGTTPLPRWIPAIAVAVVLAVSVNTGSRGGLASMVLGLVILFPLLRMARRAEGKFSERERWYVIAAVALAVGAGAVLAVVAATESTFHLLGDANLKKLKMVFWVPPMIRDYWFFGVGRGAFEGAFPAYKMGDNNSVFSHPENFLLQWATEWGLPVTCAIVVLLAWLMRPAAWGAGKTSAGSGLFAGFVALVAQNIVDLGLEVPGVAIGASAAAGFAWGDRAGVSASDEAPFRVRALLSLVVGVVGAALLVVAAGAGTNTLKRDKELIRHSFPEDRRSAKARAEFKGQLRAVMTRHPAEAYFPRQGALFAMVSRGENPVPWIQRALELAQTSGRTHYLLATLLGRYGIRAQSLLELRYAVERDEDLTGRAARLAMRLTKSPDELMRAVPDGPGGGAMLYTFGDLFRTLDPGRAYQFFEEVVDRNPNATGARLSMARMVLGWLEDQRLGARCAQERRTACQARVIEHIRALARENPQDDLALELAARLLVVAGRPGNAAALLAAQCPAVPKRSRCAMAWVEAASRTGVSDELTRAIKFAERDGCSSPRACAQTYWNIGDVVARARGPYAALFYYRRSVTEEPNKARWLRLAAVAATIGSHAEASRALDHAAAFGGGAELQRSQERERMKAMKDSLGIH